MDLSNLNKEERRKVEVENLAKATFLPDNLIHRDDELNFYEELKKYFGNVKIIKCKINAHNDMLWGSMGMQQFTNELLNISSLKSAIVDLMPYQERYELKNEITMGGNLFNLLGDLCSILKRGGCYGSGTNLDNDEIIRITKQFIDDNLMEGYEMYHYIKINEPWNRWFSYQPIYAITYLLLNLYRDELLMICISDTD